MAKPLPVADSRTAQDALAEAIGHHRAGRLGDAERLYREVLRIDGRNAEALHLLGMVAQQAGDLGTAVRLIRAAIGIEPDRAIYRSNLGNALQLQGNSKEAVGEYEQALRLRPESAPALSNLGAAMQSLGRLDEAEARLRRAAELMPDSAQVQDNLGNVLQSLGHGEEAVERHRRAIALAPGNAEAHGNLGLAWQGLGQWARAMECYERALELDPSNARIALARAQLQLLLGNFADGYRNFESRKRVHGGRALPGREWRGEAVAGGRILLYAEQGLGDTVQFLRYLAPVRERVGAGAGMILEVQEPLLRLARELPGVERVVCAGEALPDFDWHCSLMSLPLVFHDAPVPARTPYLTVPGAASQKASRRPWPESGIRVGLVWAGNPAHVRDRFRSIPFRLFEPLLGIASKEVHFYALQMGAAGAESRGSIADLTSGIEDMADTAGLIQQLDLTIGVDTAAIHLAGALGRPVWTLLPFSPDWRWGLEREDCTWYRTMRLFRQRKPGDWAEAIERVRGALTQEMAKGRAA